MKHILNLHVRMVSAALIGASMVAMSACSTAATQSSSAASITTTEGAARMASLPDPFLGFTKFNVKDIDAMETFYVETFGFKRADVIANNSFEERIMRLPGGTTSLVLYHHKDGREIIVGNGHGPVGLMTSDVDKMHAKALASGATEKMAPVNFGEARVSFLLDPEGHELELINMSGAAAE